MSSRRQRVISVILGGGRGTRLLPLTAPRAKPAVPLAGMYRLVDIPISNCLSSGLNQIYLLTQFNSASLHRHIREAYKFDGFGGGFVEILAAEQTERSEDWYQGTADAVRRNLVHLDARPGDLVLILSGDQLYRMDYRALIEHHRESGAKVTVAATPVPKKELSAFGLLRVQEDLKILEFVEKPKDPAVIESLLIDGERGLASMGIYLFDAETLLTALAREGTDFGKELIPGLLDSAGLSAFVFEGYWEDIGTIAAFFEANLRLTDPVPPFDFFDSSAPIFTRTRHLPPAKVNRCQIDQAIVSPGCIIDDATIRRCVVGVRSRIGAGTRLERVIMMGSQRFETEAARAENAELGRPDVGVGPGCHIENAILDMDVRIGKNVRLSPADKPDGFVEGDVHVRDGVLIVTKHGIVPDGTVI